MIFMKASRFVFASALLLIGFSRPVSSQNSKIPIDEDTKLITYKEVVPQPGDVTKLYNTAIAWVNANYENPTEATRVRDVENGKLEVRSRFKVFNTDKTGFKTDAGVINYTLKLEFKPDKYRYIFTNFLPLRPNLLSKK